MSRSPDTDDDRYGYFGWREFLSARVEILQEVDRAKSKNRSRPVRTSHGNAGEAAIRAWLESFLPKQYGVTSGFVIPNHLVGDYTLRHFDIIIYDALRSPVLWHDGDLDTSVQGAHRAIPAKFVCSVLEAKATMTRESVKEAAKKLAELNDYRDQLPSNFSSGSVFCDLPETQENNRGTLHPFVGFHEVVGFSTALILRTAVNDGLSGLVRVYPHSEMAPDGEHRLVYDIDRLRLEFLYDGTEMHSVAIGAGLTVKALWWDGAWHFAKAFTAIESRAGLAVEVGWTYDKFAIFASELLARLEGRTPEDNELRVGQVFHRVTDHGKQQSDEDGTGLTLALPADSKVGPD